MQKFKDLWELTTAVIRWGTLAIGGVCLLVVCMTTGWFPEDMTVGEGVALYFIFVGFLLVYAAYWLGVTSIGLLVMRWPLGLINWFDKKAPSHEAGYILSSFKSMWAWPVWAVATIAIVYAALWVRVDVFGALLFGAIILFQGVWGGVLLVSRRRLQLDASGLSVSDRIVKEKHPEDTGEIRKLMYAFLLIWLLVPAVLGQNHNALIGAAFRLAQLRKDHATIHVASPWSQRLTSLGLTPHESFLGASYSRFEDVSVRMRSIGSRVVLEVPADRRKSHFINVPRSAVEIE